MVRDNASFELGNLKAAFFKARGLVAVLERKFMRGERCGTVP